MLPVHLTKGISVPCSVIVREATVESAESKRGRKYIRKMFEINEVHLISLARNYKTQNELYD